MRYEVKELGIGGILDQAINLFKNHFTLLMGISLYLLIPFQIVQALITYALMPDMSDPSQVQMGAPIALVVVSLLFALVFLLVVNPLTEGALIYGIASEYLDRSTSPGDAFRYSLSRLVPLLLATLYKGLLVMLGMIALIIPGIYLAFRYSFVSHAVIIEGLSGGDALKRSGELMKDNYGKVFVLGCVIFVISLLVGVVTAFIPTVLAQQLVQVLIQAVLMFFALAAIVVLYFSARCQHESFDLTILADAVTDGSGADSAPPAGGESGDRAEPLG